MATRKELLKESLNQKKKVYQELLEQNKLTAQQDLNSAKLTQESSNRGASSDYYGYINPYGIQSEALARSGLKNSGITQTNLGNAYSGYQNRLGQAASTYAQTEADINAALTSANSDARQDWLNTKADYYTNLAALKNSGNSSGSGSSNSYSLTDGTKKLASGVNAYNTFWSDFVNNLSKTKKKSTTQELLENLGGKYWVNYIT